MPFNIELLSQKDNISIKLQVVGKVINIYFNGEAQAALAARQNWTHLEGHFVDSIQELGSEEAVSLTSGVYHLKKNTQMNGKGRYTILILLIKLK